MTKDTEQIYAEHEGIPAAELAATVARYGKALRAVERLCLDEDTEADELLEEIFGVTSRALSPEGH